MASKQKYVHQNRPHVDGEVRLAAGCTEGMVDVSRTPSGVYILTLKGQQNPENRPVVGPAPTSWCPGREGERGGARDGRMRYGHTVSLGQGGMVCARGGLSVGQLRRTHTATSSSGGGLPITPTELENNQTCWWRLLAPAGARNGHGSTDGCSNPDRRLTCPNILPRCGLQVP